MMTMNTVGCNRSEIYLVSGSSSVAPLMHLLLNGDQFSEPKFLGFNESTNLRVAYNPSGSSAGETGIANNTIKMGFTSRDVKSEYLDNLEYGVFSMAIDGMIVIAKLPNNCSVKNIPLNNRDKLRDIYQGKPVTWKELLGEQCASNDNITGINRESGSGTRDV